MIKRKIKIIRAFYNMLQKIKLNERKRMKIQKRRVNSKRQTVGYQIEGIWYSIAEAVNFAKRGLIKGVAVRDSGKSEYLISTTRRKLSELPTVVVLAKFPTHRILTSHQHHTLGYVINGKSYSRDEVVALATAGRVTDISPLIRNGRKYVKGKKIAGKSLYSLPTVKNKKLEGRI
jgi:hypothetical protein